MGRKNNTNLVYGFRYLDTVYSSTTRFEISQSGLSETILWVPRAWRNKCCQCSAQSQTRSWGPETFILLNTCNYVLCNIIYCILCNSWAITYSSAKNKKRQSYLVYHSVRDDVKICEDVRKYLHFLLPN